MMKALAIMAMLSLPIVSVSAQDGSQIDQSKLYVSQPEACAAIEARGNEAWAESDFISLSFADGMQGTEFQCHFMDVKTLASRGFIFVSSICELPGEIYPDTLAITPYDDKTIQVVSSYDTAMVAAGKFEPGSQGADGTFFHRCDNLSEIHFD